MINRVFIGGDIHGEVSKIKKFCEMEQTTTEDILILLGDVGLNYTLDKYDKMFKEYISKLPITILCIHGNHEERPANIGSYLIKSYEDFGCNCWVEENYPNIIFPFDGKMTIKNKTFLVMGGAYSVDKYYRLLSFKKWFKSEQMSEETKNYIRRLVSSQKDYDYVLTHTAPVSEEPTYLFLAGIDQDSVEKDMEIFLEEIKNKINFKHWYFGHYHDDKNFKPKFTILYNNFINLGI